MDLGLKGVHALVTGASGGIGLEICRVFLEQGANVTAHYNSNLAPLNPILAEFGSERIVGLQANLTSEVAVQDLFENASTSSFGNVEVLILNHGIWPTAFEPLWMMPLERWRTTIDVNLTASFIVAKEYLKWLEASDARKKDQATIVLIGSSAGLFGEAGHADYAASKAAMMYGLTLSLKNEIVKIAPKGRVNCIAPGWVKTPMAEEALKDPEIVYAAMATTPLKKVATPRDVANQTVVISSSLISGHVTGQIIAVHGGLEGRLLNKPEDL